VTPGYMIGVQLSDAGSTLRYRRRVPQSVASLSSWSGDNSGEGCSCDGAQLKVPRPAR
jgi:hypothetical protein